MKKLRLAVILAVVVVVLGAFPFAAGAAGGSKSKKALFRKGARLWPVYCGQCHQARPGGEFSPKNWGVVMMHMRARANLSGENTRAMLEYLKAR